MLHVYFLAQFGMSQLPVACWSTQESDHTACHHDVKEHDWSTAKLPQRVCYDKPPHKVKLSEPRPRDVDLGVASRNAKPQLVRRTN